MFQIFFVILRVLRG